MLEHLAPAILSSTRPSTSSSSSFAHVALRAIAMARTTHNFETRGISSWKGKCRDDTPQTDSDIGGMLKEYSGHEERPRSSPLKTRISRQRHRELHRALFHSFTRGTSFQTSPCFAMFIRSVTSSAAIPKRLVTSYSRSKVLDLDGSTLSRFNIANDVRDASWNLEEGWFSFSEVHERGLVKKVSNEALFKLAQRIANHKEVTTGNSLAVLRSTVEWGNCLKTVLGELETRKPFDPVVNLRYECLICICKALSGHPGDAQKHLREVFGSIAAPFRMEHYQLNRTYIIDAYCHAILSSWRHLNPTDAFKFLVREWNALRLLNHSRNALQRDSPFSGLIQSVVQDLEDPAIMLEDEQDDWSKSQKAIAYPLIIRTYCVCRMPHKANQVLRSTQSKNIDVSIPVQQLHVVRCLTEMEMYEEANTLYSNVDIDQVNDEQFYHRTGLHLFAHQGDTQNAEEKFAWIETHGLSTPGTITLLLHASAINGDTEKVLEIFETYFSLSAGNSPSTSHLHKPNLIHYTTVIFAYAQRGDYDGMNKWLEMMTQKGHSPDLHVYNVILKSFALRGEMDSVVTVMDQMRSAHFYPDAVSYTTVIKLLAQRNDPLTAENLFKRALREGVVPDRAMVTAVMNAHVEAALWPGVIRCFDYLRTSRARFMHLGIEVYNTLLKAYVLIGAPFHVVADIFHKLEQARVRPTARTFALLIQSACDFGKMDIASQLFVEMDQLSRYWQSNLHINAYVMTIIMAGYLRLGRRGDAKAVYDDMLKRGIQPTTVTFGTILRSYANEKSEESLRIAEDFLRSLTADKFGMRELTMSTGGRVSALEGIYAPLMNVYAAAKRAEDVERLFSDMLSNSGTPSLATLTILLDVYRRNRNVEGARQLWPQIFDLALRLSKTDDLLEPEHRQPPEYKVDRQANILCVPLSIYIDSLSAGGYHLEIAAVWNKLRDEGFQFDSHNWNHLVVALVRAGEPERAFEVLERVILPYHDQAQQFMRTRPTNPDSPLVFDTLAAELMEDEPPAPLNEAGMHRQKRRIQGGKRRERKLGSSLDYEPGEDEDDYAQPLHVLHQILPSWNTWRPHGITLSVLSQVLRRLEAGFAITPVERHGATGSSLPEVFVRKADPQISGHEPMPDEVHDGDVPNGRRPPNIAVYAREVHQRILTKYGRAVEAVEVWERMERRRDNHFY
ncbi:hypothetical protein BD410DRAFT_758956 [Rickenella mellea]|uniref:Pentacotripeptide-repeat region of PRORP domain-containing protein n=1 Tax=Rickenella mellea TaxID=50990 RepID=A0A4R5XFG5_9AGAM|nr:hypothetical protein BD410DRAFT_758956 [Rickenella mellea]